MVTSKELKIKLIENGHNFKKLIEADGRSQQYIYREIKKGNQKVLTHLINLVDHLQ